MMTTTALITVSTGGILGASAGGHGDPVAPVVLALAIILLGAKLCGELASRLGQPAVLGELIFGVLLGNLDAIGVVWFERFTSDPSLDILARLGVLLLLFEVGLESTLAQMMRVGLSSLFVAVLGVVTPVALGWGVGAWWLPEAGPYVHAFLGATLAATSVGITARVFQDLDRSRSNEARIIIGAAVVDDVLGLIILAAVTGVIAAASSGEAASYAAIGWILAKALLFLGGAILIGMVFSKALFSLAAGLRSRGVLLALGLSFCFLLAWLSDLIGLAPIVGAFAAGLLLEESHYRRFVERGEPSLEHLIHPVSSMLVPVFFVLMGMHTDLRAFAAPGVLGLAAALTIAAILGKQACSLGVVGGGIDRLTVGLGMIPRGEVGLIFANIGMSMTLHGKPLLDSSVLSAVVAMVIVTTFVTPPALKWSLGRSARR